MQRVPYRLNPRRNTLRDILINLTEIKHKERILKAATEKQQVTYKGKPIRLTMDLSAETQQTRRERQDIFKVLKEKNLQPWLLYPAKIFIQSWWRIQKLYRQAEVKRIQHDQTSHATNTKRTYISSKHKRKGGPTKTNPKQSRKCQ